MSLSRVKLIGQHNIANVMAAVEIWRGLYNYLYRQGRGLERSDYEIAREAIESFAGVAHRMEFVADIDGIRYINNSMCTNPAAVAASVSAIETPLVAIAGGYHKGGDLTPMYEALKQYTRHVVLIGTAKEEIADGLCTAGMDESQIEFAETLRDAVDKAVAVAVSGDTVMLVPGCASFDMFTGFEQRGQVFRDAVKAKR